MTLNDKLTIERAIGLLEGLSFGAEPGMASGLNTAIEMISEIMDRESVDDTAKEDNSNG